MWMGSTFKSKWLIILPSLVAWQLSSSFFAPSYSFALGNFIAISTFLVVKAANDLLGSKVKLNRNRKYTCIYATLK